ncbi:MAG: ABC transporter permease [Saprospiraceae bacterium]|nr:ABC transporter permease [Saprospiraceae bacterium]
MLAKSAKLEYLKFRRYRPFWIILGLFVLAFFAVGFSMKALVDFFVRENANDLGKYLENGLPLFDFVDIWQNLAYITFLFKYILAFVVVISICLEYSNKTIRQNMIDGLSHREYLFSKLSLMVLLSLIAGALLTLLGLALGLMYSPVKSLDFVVLNMEFVLAYMFEVFCFLALAMFVATLLRRTGFAIVLFVLYSLAIEPIITAIMEFNYELEVWYFPVKSINNLIHIPFGKYIFREVQDFVSLREIGVATFWMVLWIFLTYQLIRKRDA